MRWRQNDRLVLKGAGFSLFPQRIQRWLLNCVNWHHLKGHSWEGICALQVSYNFVSITNIYLIFPFFFSFMKWIVSIVSTRGLHWRDGSTKCRNNWECILHCTVYTIHCTLYTIHCNKESVHYIYCTVYYSKHYTVYRGQDGADSRRQKVDLLTFIMQRLPKVTAR